MAGKCANNWCATLRHQNTGKLFRLDLNFGSKSGGKDARTVEYLWLCDCCAQVMHPKLDIRGDTIALRLVKNDPIQRLETPLACADSNAQLKRAN